MGNRHHGGWDADVNSSTSVIIPLLSSCSLCRMEMGDKDKTGVADGPCTPGPWIQRKSKSALGNLCLA